MENIPPTYAMATSQDHWTIIAPYIASQDLCSAALVCSRWHEMFAPHLWGNPASHFATDYGVEDDAIYVALTRFKRTLAWARLYVRQMTHTLRLPPAHPQLYDGPHSDWLRDVLEQLPRLQSLIVNGLPFFDHSALLTLRYFSGRMQRMPAHTLPSFGLRFLDARRCTNVTSTGLTEALCHFHELLYLDLSGTAAARSASVLAVVGSLPNLQILKLRDLGLRDDDVAVLVENLGLRIRSLDVRNNALTDASARLLLQNCFSNQQGPTAYDGQLGGALSRRTSQFIGDVLRHHRDEKLDSYLQRRLTTGLVDRLAIEDSAKTGITHLYVSNNRLSAEGISGFLRSTQLHVLDCGDVARVLPDQTLLSAAEAADVRLALPGVGKLTPVIASMASRNLTYLRINYEIITEEAPEAPLSKGSRPATPIELPVGSEVFIPRNTYELQGDSTMPPPRSELDSVSIVPELSSDTTQVFELPGDTVFMHVSPAVDSVPSAVDTVSPFGDTPSPAVGTLNSAVDTLNSAVDTLSSGSGTVSSFTDSERRGRSGRVPSLIRNGSRFEDESDVSPASDTESIGRAVRVRRLTRNASLLGNDGDQSPSLVLNASGTGLTPEAAAMNGQSSRTSSRETSQAPQMLNLRQRSYSSVVRERRMRAALHQSQHRFLRPSMTPKLQTLVLTDVPSHTWTMEPVKRLIQFITDCAEEAELAWLQAKVGYAMPPGQRGRLAAQREYARSVFALQRIILELAPPESVARRPTARWRKYPTMSSTEDEDSETFWSAAQHDFSFFGDEECGLPGRNNGRYPGYSEKMVVTPDQQQSWIAPMQPEEPEIQLPSFDVVAELSKFRKERKALYQAALKAGNIAPEIAGYWEGEMKVIRPAK